MEKPYAEQSASAQNAYADLYDAALAAHVAAGVAGLNGSFARKTVHGREYWYFQFRDIGGAVKQLYLGPASDKLAALIQNHRNHQPKPLQRLAAAAIALGCEPMLPKHFRVIRRLGEYGFFRRGGILAGTHAFLAMTNMLGITSAERMQTQDVDFAHAGKNISVALPANIVVETANAIESLQMGLLPISTLDGKPGGTYLSPADPAFRLDFLTSRDSDSDAPVYIEGLSIALQPLRFMEFSLVDTVQAAVISSEGTTIVNIPRPDRFAIHKLIVSAERDAVAEIKSNKDVRQANVLIQYYLDHRSEELAETCREAYQRGPGWRKRLTAGMARLERINPEAAGQLRIRCQ